MNFPLIGLHAWLGEFSALMFVWAFIELLSGNDANMRRARLATLLGLVFVVFAWLAGGYYYVEIYGQQVKPFIKEGPLPWAHMVIMETKEHVFLFMPFVALLTLGLLQRLGQGDRPDQAVRTAALYASGTVAVMAVIISLCGFLVSSGFRSALEALVT